MLETSTRQSENRQPERDAKEYYQSAARCLKNAQSRDDITHALKLLNRAADLGLNEARYQLGVFYFEGKYGVRDVNLASEWFRLAADDGFSPAQFALASSYMQDNKHEQAISLLAKLADKGVIEAKTNLADCYLNGKGGEKDVKKALVLFEEAAEHGDRLAQYQLGLVNFQGSHIPTDYIKARKYTVLAMEQRYLPAYLVMGAMLEHGFGINKDILEAYGMYCYCDQYGIPDLESLINDVFSSLNDIEKQQAKMRAQEWCQNEPAPN